MVVPYTTTHLNSFSQQTIPNQCSLLVINWLFTKLLNFYSSKPNELFRINRLCLSNWQFTYALCLTPFYFSSKSPSFFACSVIECNFTFLSCDFLIRIFRNSTSNEKAIAKYRYPFGTAPTSSPPIVICE